MKDAVVIKSQKEYLAKRKTITQRIKDAELSIKKLEASMLGLHQVKLHAEIELAELS